MAKKNQVKYEYAVNGLYKVAAQTAAEELDRIRNKYGALDPEMVVNESRDEDSVLHNIFCWDDTVAAANYRKIQAQGLIRNIRVIVTNKKIDVAVRAYVNVRETPGSYRNYVPTVQAIANETAYNDLLQQSKSEMESFVAKYSQVEELNGVKAEMLKAITFIK